MRLSAVDTGCSNLETLRRMSEVSTTSSCMIDATSTTAREDIMSMSFWHSNWFDCLVFLCPALVYLSDYAMGLSLGRMRCAQIKSKLERSKHCPLLGGRILGRAQSSWSLVMHASQQIPKILSTSHLLIPASPQLEPLRAGGCYRFSATGRSSAQP